MSMKNPLTPAGIEPATLQFVAQHLNHCAAAVPQKDVSSLSNLIIWLDHTYLFPTNNFLLGRGMFS